MIIINLWWIAFLLIQSLTGPEYSTPFLFQPTGVVGFKGPASSSSLSSRRLSAMMMMMAASRPPDPSSKSHGILREGKVTLLEQGQQYVVVYKPPAVVCHHCEWTGTRSHRRQRPPEAEPQDSGSAGDPREEDDDDDWGGEEVPMLQRVRQALQGRRVNLIHRLDRGCSGCLLMTYDSGAADTDPDWDDGPERPLRTPLAQATSTLMEAMAQPTCHKTYVALVRGEGLLHGTDLKQQGWFLVDRPIRDEQGKLHQATTWFRFVAGQVEDASLHQPRAALVLAKPQTGRWHQIRRHLNGLSHPILGDTRHGDSHVNRAWRQTRGLRPQRTCLHLARLVLPANPVLPHGLNVSCPLAPDLLQLLKQHMPRVWEEAQPILLHEEGLLLEPTTPDADPKVLPFQIWLPSPPKHTLRHIPRSN